ncbi:hydrogenase maturation peptidase HycI [Methanobrevibacter sp.]
MSFKAQLKDFLKDYQKLIILGIGNELKSDDGVGPYIIRQLKLNTVGNENTLFIDAQAVPENFTGKIKNENPTHILIVDACLMDSNPGDIKIVPKDDFADIGISTHLMSLSYFVKYLEQAGDYKIIFVGIEPETMDWGDTPTAKVEKTANEFIEMLKGLLL